MVEGMITFMKQHITLEDIELLSDSQLQTLNKIWMPQKYGIAAALICKDVSCDKYEKVEFIIGSIGVYHTIVTLYDLKYLINTCDEPVEDEDKEEEEEEGEGEEEDMAIEDDINFTYEQPISYNKEDCIPLLSIGQMIEILQRNNYGLGDFYLVASSNDSMCELGKNYANMNSYGNEYENKELCDVLWESIKAIL